MMIEHDVAQIRQLTSLNDYDHYTQAQDLLRSVFKPIFPKGFHTRRIPEEEFFSPMLTTALEGSMEDFYSILGRRRSQPSGVLQLVRHALKYVGLGMEKKPYGKNKAKVGYQLYSDKYERMRELAYSRRLRRGEDASQFAPEPVTDVDNVVETPHSTGNAKYKR